MSIKVKCPGCTKVLTVPDAAKGKSVKCPSCETRVAVPGDGDGSKSAAGKPKKPVKKVAADDESGLLNLDLGKVADHEANVCPKCGYDLELAQGDSDEPVTECPQCGWDIEEGGLGEKARKKALKGPDPDKFFPGLWKNSWKFVLTDNLMISIRTFLYIKLASIILFLALFMYLWISKWPPRYFFALVAVVSAMVIPGWLWFLDTETIKLTLERRDKFKRLNFDFFLSSALGVKFFAWNIVFAGPLLAIPGLAAWAMYQYAGLPWWIIPAVLAVCYIPIIPLWPVALTHMTMPIQSPGWMFWKIIPMALRCFKGVMYWFLLFAATNFPIVLIMAGTLFFTVEPINDYVQLMEKNAEINRAQYLWDYYGSSKMKPKDLVDPKSLGELAKVEFRHMLALGLTEFAWLVSVVILSLTGPFNMRTNGYFAYYFRDFLDLQVLIKEKKYVAIISRDPEKKIKTTAEIAVEGLVAVVVFMIMGTIFGLLYGAMSDFGPVNGLVMGNYYGAVIANFAAVGGLIYAAFQVSPVWGLLVFFSPCMCGIPYIMFLIKEWEEGKLFFFQGLFANLVLALLAPITLMMGIGPVAERFKQMEPANQQAPLNPGAGDPAAMQPGAGPGAGGPGPMPPAGAGAAVPPGGPMPPAATATPKAPGAP